MDIIEHILSLVNKEKTFNSLSCIKANSFLTALDVDHSDKSASYLCIGKSLVPFGLVSAGYKNVSSINCLCEEGVETKYGINHIDLTIDQLVASGTKFEYVIAPDEWLTYSSTEAEQLKKIEQASKLANIGFYTTLKDYKNLNAAHRFFQEPFQIKTDTGDCFVVRKRDWKPNDKQAWTDKSYIIHNDQLIVGDQYKCRTMYFKQLAKFITDAGAKSYQVEKKIMYKPLFSKSFEYIIYVTF